MENIRPTIIRPDLPGLEHFSEEQVAALGKAFTMAHEMLSGAPLGSWIENGQVVHPSVDNPGSTLIEEFMIAVFGYVGVEVYDAPQHEWDHAKAVAISYLREEARLKRQDPGA